MGSPILIYEPEGGVPSGAEQVGEAVNGQGITQLVNGQSYIDVTFDTEQTDNTWIFVECSVVNTADSDPLNIWPGIITVKTSTGFRLQLNGMPDSNNYFLNWAISGVNIVPPEPFPATTYTLTGPSSGNISVASTDFTVRLPLGATVASPVTVTPSDGGGGGTFTPTTVTLTTGAPLATFTYTPASYGAKTISVTNDGTLTDPASLVYTCFASTYTLSGPSSGAVSVPSTNFTVALPAGGVVTGTVTVTPHDAGDGGTFTPTTVGLTTAAPSATFTYTPASSGTKTISATNNGGLTNPANLSYSSTAPFDPTTITGLKLWLKADAILVADGGTDGSNVTPWRDQSGNSYDLAGGGTYKTNILNGKSVVRFNGLLAGDHYGSVTSPIIPAGTTGYTVFIVINAATISAGSFNFFAVNNSATDAVILRRDADTLNHYQWSGSGFANNTEASGIVVGAWNYITIDWNGSNIHMWRNGVSKGASPAITTIPTAQNFTAVGYDNISGTRYFGGDIAEIIVYNSALSGTDRGNCELYLKNKYGL